jgi:hypothetical protein
MGVAMERLDRQAMDEAPRALIETLVMFFTARVHCAMSVSTDARKISNCMEVNRLRL